jgi:hypothetical protein
MKFFRQGKFETWYGLDFRSYFATLGIDRLFGASPRARARATCGEKIRWSAIVLEESGYTKNGMFADIYKTLVSSAAATARSAELVCFHRRHLGQKVLRAACLTPPPAGVGAPAVQLGGIDASGRGGIDEVPDRLVIASSSAPSLGRQRSGSVQPTTTISSRCGQLASSPPHYCDDQIGQGREFHDRTCALSLGGMVSKRADTPTPPTAAACRSGLRRLHLLHSEEYLRASHMSRLTRHSFL